MESTYVQLFPIDKLSLPLLDYEAKRFKQWAKEVNIDAKIKPAKVILDLNTNKAIITTYYIDYDSCPFLKNNKCLIYNKKRAFICRFFPFNKSPFLNTGDEFNKKEMFGSCPAIKDIIPNLENKNNKTAPKSGVKSGPIPEPQSGPQSGPPTPLPLHFPGKTYHRLIGRSQELEQLLAALREPERKPVIAIVGL